MKTILLLILTSLLVSVSCSTSRKSPLTQPVVKPLSDTVKMREGTVIYALPLTVFTIKVEMERTIDIPGPYARYSSDLLGLNGVVRSRTERWSVKGVSVSTHEEADPSEYYVIETGSGFATNAIALKSEGLILDLNPAGNPQGLDLLKSKELNVSRFMSYDLGSDEYYQVRTDTAFRRVKIDSSFIRIPYTVEKRRQLQDDQLAERAAKRIMDLRDGKVLILTGEANVFPQSNAAIDEINRMEEEYTQLFTGKTITLPVIYTCQYIPVRETSSGNPLLLKFSASAGPLSQTSAEGIPVTIEVVPEQKTKDLTVITREQQGTSAVRTDKLFYRLPDVAGVRINLGNDVIYSSRKLVYQLGEIMQLPANFVIGSKGK